MGSTALDSTTLAKPTPTGDDLPRRLGDFNTLVEALEYAAHGKRGLNFYSARGELEEIATYADLRRRALEIGRKLSGLGYEAGERIALIAETSPDFVAFFLGCQYARILPVPLPLPTSFGGREAYVEQLRNQLKSCAASALVGPSAMLDILKQAGEGARMDFVGSHDDFAAMQAPEGPIRLPQPDDVAYLQYSSGSTRFPHGIAVTHRAVVANCRGQGRDGVQLRDDDRCISWLPFYHDMGLVGTLLTPIVNQVSVDYLATEDFARRPLQWLRLMSRNRGTISYSPTFGYEIAARRAGEDLVRQLDLSAWRVAGIGGDMIRPDVLRLFVEVFGPAGFRAQAFVPSYGLAECTLAVSFMPLDRGIEVDVVDERVLSGERPMKDTTDETKTAMNGNASGTAGVVTREVVNCGRILPDHELEIRDEDGNALGEREVGRIFVRGPSVMKEYFRDEQATCAVLSPDGWLDTGDMGYMRDGFLYVVGRAKDMIIVNGRNHWPQDLEWAAEQLPDVRSGDVAAISLPGSRNEEVPTVLVHCRLRDEQERAAFAERVRRQVQESTGVNCRVVLIPPRTLPRTSSGKLSRTKARQQFLSGAIPALDQKTA
ncbi:MAG: fatty acyl-AMP ligase [Alphaproteobacteria bacterium]|nr:MAG: fatty acyl-AMP ligase [Alphaproteobacteria bacterium]